MNSSGSGTHPDVSPATANLEKIAQIAITVDDVAQARDFYQNILGMKFLFEAGNLVFFKCGDIRLMLTTPENNGPRGGTILYFKVDDIHATYSAFKERGVTFIDEPHLIARMPDHDLWMVFLKDPFANTLGIMSEVRP